MDDSLTPPMASTLAVPDASPAPAAATPAEPSPVALMERLRSETRAHHDATEDLPFSRAIIAGTLSMAAYRAQMQALHEIYSGLESSLAACEQSGVQSVWHDGLRKRDALERDLEYLDGVVGAQANANTNVLPDLAARDRVTLEFVAAIENWALDDPIALLGVLYVFEGSMMGSMVLRKHLASSLELTPERGLAYHSVYGREIRRQWQSFRAAMDSAVPDEADRDRVVAAASETFDRIGQLLRCLA